MMKIVKRTVRKRDTCGARKERSVNGSATETAVTGVGVGVGAATVTEEEKATTTAKRVRAVIRHRIRSELHI